MTKAACITILLIASFHFGFGQRIDTLLSQAQTQTSRFQYANAEKLYLKAYSVSISDDYSIDHLKVLNKMIVFYFSQGNFASAEKYIAELIEIKRIGARDKYEYYEALETIGNICRDYKDWRVAEELFVKAIDCRKIVLGDEHPDYISSLMRLCNFYGQIGEIDKQENIYLEVFRIRKSTCKTRLEYLEIVSALGKLYTQKKDPNQAAKYYLMVAEHIHESISSAQRVLTEHEWLSYLAYSYIWENVQEYKSFLCNYHDISDSLNISIYNNELLLKNGYLRNILQLKNSIHKSNSGDLISLYEEYIALRKKMFEERTKLNRNNLLPISERLYDNEKKLKSLSKDFEKNEKIFGLSYDSVRAMLGPDEIAIENISFRKSFLNDYRPLVQQVNGITSTTFGWSDSILNGVLICKKTFNHPIFVQLFEQRQFDSLLRHRSNVSDSDFYSSFYATKGYDLNRLILQPLTAALTDVKTIYFAPFGILNSINLSAVPFDGRSTLGEKFSLHVIGSTAEISDNKKLNVDIALIKSAVIYGGIDYDNSARDSFSKNEISPIGYEQIAEVAKRSGSTRFSYLPQTARESENIRQICLANGIKVMLYEGEKATEESIKSLSGKKDPFILHVATHGYFFANNQESEANGKKTKNIFKWSDDPLLRSGLIFAGANRTWGMIGKLDDSVEDGILTSYEISNLDLRNCQLVVLSACETGLGDIKGSEGVFGLQRAFKMAGVKNIIMSLWRVPDKETQQLMTLFYHYWFSGKSIHDALQAAQSEMKLRGYTPYYWAGFKLLE